MKQAGKKTACLVMVIGLIVLAAGAFACRDLLWEIPYKLNFLERQRGVLGLYVGHARGAKGVTTVKRVLPGGPAEKADIREDDVIVEINGLSVATPEEFVGLLRACYSGQAVAVVLRRAGKTLEKRIELATFPYKDEGALPPARGPAGPAAGSAPPG